MTSLENIYVVEYSPKQNAFHVDSLAHSIQGNLEIFRTGVGDPWMLMGVFQFQSAANRFAGELQAARDAKG